LITLQAAPLITPPYLVMTFSPILAALVAVLTTKLLAAAKPDPTVDATDLILDQRLILLLIDLHPRAFNNFSWTNATPLYF